jgi:hypothetical protein
MQKNTGFRHWHKLCETVRRVPSGEFHEIIQEIKNVDKSLWFVMARDGGVNAGYVFDRKPRVDGGHCFRIYYFRTSLYGLDLGAPVLGDA